MRLRRLVLGVGALVIITGAFLAANATIIPHETSFSTRSNSVGMRGSGEYFTFTGATLTPNNAPQIVAGTTTVGDAFILAASPQQFSSWVCYQLPRSSFSSNPDYDCSAGVWGEFNVSILDAYLQSHPSVIEVSRVIVGQNVTLAYGVRVPTNVTIVFARMVLPPTNSTDYLGVTFSNESVTYPILGWNERSESLFNLLNLSLGIVLTGAVILAVGQRISNPPPTKIRPMRKCDVCGGENLYFAGRCGHCGTMIHQQSPKAPPVPTS